MDVTHRLRGAPPAREPRPDAPPDVPRPVALSVLHVVQPLLLAVVVRAQDRTVVVGVEGSVLRAERWTAVVRLLHLEDPERKAAITDGRHVPVRLDRRDGAEEVRVEAPLARRPLQDLVGRAAVVARYAEAVHHLAPPTKVPQLVFARAAAVCTRVVRSRFPARFLDAGCGLDVAERLEAGCLHAHRAEARG